MDETAEGLVAGLTNPSAVSLARFPIRTREGSVTLSAWRLELAAEEGEGAIILVEISPGWTIYRGDRLLLGWTQERLEAAYRALLPKSEEPDFVTNQLG